MLLVLGVSFGDWLGIAGLAVAAIGIPFAGYQLWLQRKEVAKTLSAAEAAKEAIVSTEAQAALIELLQVLPRMQRLERDITLAIAGGSPSAVRNHLQDWRVLAAETRGVLAEQTGDTQELQSWLARSGPACAAAIEALDRDDLIPATKGVITIISTACELAGLLLGRLKSRPGEWVL